VRYRAFRLRARREWALLLPAFGANQQQIGDIGTRYQENDS
jgi:hypothetical protein